MDLNKVILIGRLTRDSELKYTTSDQAVSKFSLAVDRRVKGGGVWKTEANFFDVTLWGKMAESLNQYLTKGKQVAIDGELRQNRWQQEGVNHSKVEVVAHTVQLLGGGEARAPGQRAAASQEAPTDQQPEFTDDIPFN